MKGAIFDLDGTLLDSMWFWKGLANNYLLSIDIEPPTDLRDTLKKLSLLEGCHYLKERFKLDKTPKEINDEMEILLSKQYVENFQLKPYVHEILEDLKNRNIKMCLATATEDRLVEMAFKRLGIGDYFEFIQTSNRVGIGKNDPRFFEIATERLELSPKDIWVFEDALHCIISAKHCGLNVVALSDEAATEDLDEIKKYADMYIDDFSNLELDKL